jgi:CubicO group peptidase (beta-lactamase class C family)
MRPIRTGLALALAAAPAVAGTPAPPSRPAAPHATHARAIARSRELLDQALQLYPGTAVAVAVGDRIVWSTAFGYADVDRLKAVSPATQFRIYEAAMPLTATVLARLAQDGRVDLDAPVHRYLPELPDSGATVTLRDLASQTAGVRDFGDDEEIPSPCSGARDAVRTITGRVFVRPPGLGINVSRYGYLLLTAALEAASGRRFEDLLADTVGGPAGMTSTMMDDPRRFLPGRTQFYERGFLGLLKAARIVDTSCLSGAGGLVSTTEDLVRFGAALLRGELVRGEMLEAMLTPRRTRGGQSTGYGLGWHVETDARGRPFAWHGGRGVGGRAAIVIVPHVRLVTVMLSNIEGERLDEHARRIAAYFLEDVEASSGAPDLLRAARPEKNPSPPFAARALPAPGE